MKRKVIMLLLMTMTAAMLATGCKTNTNTSENTVTSEQSATENASIDLITEWEAKASVTLGDKVKIDGDGISQDGDVLTITEGGAYSFTGTSDQICILVDTEDDVKIVLNGVAMTNATGPVIYGKNSNSIYIETAEGTTNVLSDGSDYDTDDDGKAIGKATIFSKDDLIFLGSGSLEVTGNFKHGICSNDAIYFEGGTYDITASVKDGVHANDLITVDDGTFTIDAASDVRVFAGSAAFFAVFGGSCFGVDASLPVGSSVSACAASCSGICAVFCFGATVSVGAAFCPPDGAGTASCCISVAAFTSASAVFASSPRA